MEIKIQPDGTTVMIYSDDLLPILDQYKNKEIIRASHVEPDAEGNWFADLSPTFPGVKLGPFKKREAALAAEVEYLKVNL